MMHIPSISQYRQGALVASLALMLAACGSSDEYQWEMWDTGQQEGTPVSIIAEDGTEESLKAGSTLGVFVVSEDGTVTWMTVVVDKDGSIILPPEAQTGKVMAYAPEQPGWGLESFTTTQRFEVQPDQSKQADYDASDLMIGTITTATRSQEVRLQLRHMLAKVVVHIVDETGAIDSDNASMRLLRMAGTVNVNLSAMQVSTVENSQIDIDMLPYNVTDRRISLAAIVAPQTIEEGVDFLEFTVAGSHRTCQLPSKTELEGNKTFVFQMRYTDEGLVPEGSYIVAWEDDGSETEFNIRTNK